MHKICSLITSFLIKLIPIRPTSKRQNNAIILQIIFQELLFLIIIANGILKTPILGQKLNSLSLVIAFYALNGIRLLNSLIFLILKLQVLYAFHLILLMLLQLLLSQKTQNIYLSIASLLLQILMAIVYALGKEVRNNNINLIGKLNIAPYLMRLLITFIAAFLTTFFKSEALLLSILILVLIKIVLIQKQKKTNLFIKSAQIRLEVINLLILMIGIFSKYLQFSFVYFLSLSSVLLILYVIQLPFMKISPKMVYQIGSKISNQSCLQQLTTEEALQYFLVLNYWLCSNNQLQLLSFLFFHRKICKNAGCPMWFKNDQNFDQNKYPLETLKKMVSLHIQRTIFLFKKESQQLNKFTVYFLSPSSKVRNFLNENTFHGKRELYRLQNEQKAKEDSNLGIQALYKENNQEVDKKLKEMLNLRQLLYLLLLKKGINQSCIVSISQKIINLSKELISKNKTQQPISYTNNFKLNQFFLEFMPDQVMSLQMNDPEFILKSGSKQFISILLGAQGQRFGKVLNVNQQAVKWTYLSKDVLLTNTINDLVPGQFKQRHVKAIDTKYSKVTIFDSYNDIPQTIFMFNALGYIIPGKARVYRLTNQFGRYWNLIYEPNYLLDAIMIMTFQGKMIGFNEMATYYGMQKEMLGKYISKPIAQFLINSCNSKYINDFKQPLFEDYEAAFQEETTIQKVQTMERMCKYIIIRFINRNNKSSTTKSIKIDAQKVKDSYFSYEEQGQIIMDHQLNPEKQQSSAFNLQNNEVSMKNLLIGKRAQIDIQQIDQMILINNKIDYKRNIKINEEQEVQIPAKPLKSYNKKYENISKEFYKANFEKRQQQSIFWKMKWCLTLSGSTLFIVIVLIFITTALDVANIFRRQRQFEIFLLFNKQLLSYTYLGTLPINTMHDPQFDTRTVIQEISKQIQNTWKVIQEKEPNTNALISIMIPQRQHHTEYNGQLQGKQKEFLIAIKQFLANGGSQNIQSVAKYMLFAIFPGYKAVVENVDTFYRDNEIKWIYMAVFIRVSSLVLLIIAISIAIVFYRISSNNKIEILQVISRIQDDTLIQQLAKIYYLKNQAQSFQQFLPHQPQRMNVQKYQKQKVVESLQKHIENVELASKKPKKIIFEGNIHKIICLILAIAILLPIDIYQFCLYFQGVQNDKLIKSFCKYNNEMVASVYSLWTGNNFIGNFDQEQLEDLQSLILKCDADIQDLYSQGVQKQILDIDFILFYHKLMQQNVCELVQKTDCYKDFNGALARGMKQLLAFLNRKFEEINEAQNYFSSLRGIQILQSIQIKDIMKANSFYLPFTINQISENLKRLLIKLQNSHVTINSLLGLFELVLLVGIGIWAYIEIKQAIKDSVTLEGAINILPFEELIKIPFFQAMVQKNVQKI